jgi:hypothetical protein
MRLQLLTSAVLALIAVAPAGAQPVAPGERFTLGVTGGSLGIGPEASFKISPLVGIRGSATFLNFSHDDGLAGYQYRGKIRLRNYGATVDLYPMRNGFRLSAGARITDDNRIRFVGQARNTETFGGVMFTPEQQGTLSGDIKTNSVSPLVTLGYTNPTSSRFMFGIDAGAMFHGRPSVENLVATGRLATEPLVQARRIEQEQRLRDKVDNYKVYPVLQLSIGIRL